MHVYDYKYGKSKYLAQFIKSIFVSDFIRIFFKFNLQILSENRRTNIANCLSSLKVYQLTYFPHYLHPNNTLFLNDIEQEDDEMIYPSIGIQATYPVQLRLPTDINTVVEENIVLKLVQQKNNYLNEVVKLTANYKRSSKFLNVSFPYDVKMHFCLLFFKRRVDQRIPKRTYTAYI